LEEVLVHLEAEGSRERRSMSDEVILETRGLTKEFQGFVAVNGVDLRVRQGSIHALIGPNGAGKTTVFNLLTRFLPATSGSIVYRGEDVTRLEPAEVARKGLVRSFQISAVFPNLTVLENVRVALQRRLGTSFYFWRSQRTLEALDARAMELLAAVDLDASAHTVTVELPYGRKRALELATTLALEPDLILLDEPTQGMGREDVGRVVELIRKVSAGRTVLMVEHNLSVVADLSSTITVLARGNVLAEGSYSEVSRDRAVLEAYIGVDA
jgi:branched-chain amino acid transport system ATP-binding protein